MTPLDILYTPLDIPPAPPIDSTRLLQWISDYKDQQHIKDRRDSSQVLKDQGYPWDIVYAKYNYRWYQDFDKLFPEFCEYVINGFGIPVVLVPEVIILPTKTDFAGVGFWHSDNDEWGLRFYIDNPETDNFLLIRPTKQAWTARNQQSILSATDDDFQPGVEYSAKLLNSRQAFYINNVRALHATNTNTELVGTTRIAVILHARTPIVTMPAFVKDLIVRSAEKYKEHSIYWYPTSDSNRENFSF